MSVLDEKWDLSQRAQEFFVYTTLGIVPKLTFDNGNYREYLKINYSYDVSKLSYKTYCAFMCAVQAYIDLARTCEYKEGCDSQKTEFKNSIYSYLAEHSIANENTDTLIENVHCKANKYNIFLRDGKAAEFTYGQSQKWVNMTLKYLYLLGIIKNTKGLHVPIDSYIIEALWDERNSEIKIPRSKRLDKEGNELYSEEKYKEHRKKYCYSDEKVKSWSLWDFENDYDSFRKSLPKGINTKWEHKKWIEISEKRKGVK